MYDWKKMRSLVFSNNSKSHYYSKKRYSVVLVEEYPVADPSSHGVVKCKVRKVIEPLKTGD